MKNNNTLRFILHVSDFHLTDDPKQLEYAQNALKSLADKIRKEKIKVDYLVHTGDIINSSDLYLKAAKSLSIDKKYIKKEKYLGRTYKVFDSKSYIANSTKDDIRTFDLEVQKHAKARFEKAEVVLKSFISDLNISSGSVVMCCGNHDVLRPLSVSDDSISCEKSRDSWQYKYPPELNNTFKPFEEMLNNLRVANSQLRHNSSDPVLHCVIDNINFLILNTNWKNPKDQKEGYFCTQCEQVKKTIKKIGDGVENPDNFNIIISHKPIYEICEKARLSYKRYIKTSFMSSLQKFIGENGIFLCGDKHTRSIIGSYIHDIPHYIGGEPLYLPKNDEDKPEVEYNLLELSKNKLGMERKIHLKYDTSKGWLCEIRPQDDVVSKIYELCKKYITPNTFEIISIPKSSRSWETLCQEINNWKPEDLSNWYENLNKLYLSVCKYRVNGTKDISIKGKNIFNFIVERLNQQMNESTSENLLNIRGENSSGKSTFLGLMYIFLLYQYSTGKIDFIPAYFNLESEEMYNKIKSSGSYYEAVKDVFEDFVNKMHDMGQKEHHSICYIIDGLDEQDCWSYTTEDSVGRCLLNILAKHENSRYVMSFSQQRLPNFKNTMPARKYNDESDIMYFNPIDVREEGAEDNRFKTFVEGFLSLKKFTLKLNDKVSHKNTTHVRFDDSATLNTNLVDAVCNIIRKFRRLTIDFGFMYQNYDYIATINPNTNVLKNSNETVSGVYKYYIDRQNEICLNKLGYGFVEYAPAMAYLFSYKGYTYEKFKHLNESISLNNVYMYKSICENYDKVYNTFLFIKKHKDAREYLIALHYSRELRFYAEHPNIKIDDDSILNKFIDRNISIIIRKLWNDTNKFIIVCEQLLMREELSSCTLSMLIYCLAHLPIYAPIKDTLYKKLCCKAKEIIKQSGQETLPHTANNGENALLQEGNHNTLQSEIWNIKGQDNAKRLEYFVNLGLIRAMTVYEKMDSDDTVSLVESLVRCHHMSKKNASDFQIYNRQFQMLYYGDLSIQGEDKKRPLIPGVDKVYKGFDFHNCFNFLYVKLISNDKYPLREFDMFTLCDLIYSRLSVEYLSENAEEECSPNTFFYRDAFDEKSASVIEKAKSIFDKYLEQNKGNDGPMYKYFKTVVGCYDKILKERNESHMTSIKQIINDFDNEIHKNDSSEK